MQAPDLASAARALIKRLLGQSSRGGPGSDHRSVNVFDAPSYADITAARLRHLDSLGLPLAGRTVLDLGAGVGHFTEFFRSKGCSVHCVDARPDNVAKLRALYPDVRATVMDVEASDLATIGRFDVVLCYGLLYHLMDPVAVLNKVAAVCDGMLLLETCIADAVAPALFLVQEDRQNPSQTLGRWGCRPSPSFLRAALVQSGFKYLYRPRHLPDHPEFQYKLVDDHSHLRNGRLMRTVVIAARDPVASPALTAWAE